MEIQDNLSEIIKYPENTPVVTNIQEINQLRFTQIMKLSQKGAGVRSPLCVFG